MNHSRCALTLTATLVFVIGCGEAQFPQSASTVASDYQSSIGEAFESESAALAMTQPNAAVRFSPQESAGTAAATPSPAIANRKIIYNSTIGLVVDDYRQFESRLPTLVSQHGGFVANSDTDRRYNDRQSGSWVVRIPVGQYSAFLTGMSSLGFAESRQENAQDVTEEYVDVEARIRNKHSLEQRIVTMLEERTGKLSDVLEIERELSRIREEIERMEGRLRFLKDRTSLATITIDCREQKEYVPAEAPTLGSRAHQSWANSVGSLRIAGENLLVGAIAIVPWLIVMGIPLFAFVKMFKRNVANRRRAGAAS